MKTISNRRLTALLIVLWLAGCAEWGYRHMNDPSRDAWQKPQQVVERLDIEPGARVADLGAGGGYFTWIWLQRQDREERFTRSKSMKRLWRSSSRKSSRAA